MDGKRLRTIIFASSLGTLFEWYDFYLYGSLAVFFGDLFFPKTDGNAGLLASLATFGAGFGVRPLGAIVFGRVGDLIGRKYTFLVTIVTMGLVDGAHRGFLPTYAHVGLLAPALLVRPLRLAQGPRARRREAGGAATLRRRARARRSSRLLTTSYIQTTATLGFFVLAGRHRRHTRLLRAPRAQGLRLARALRAVDPSRRHLALRPAQARRIAALREAQERWPPLEESAQGELRQPAEPQVRAARPLRRHRRPGASSLVHRASSTRSPSYRSRSTSTGASPTGSSPWRSRSGRRSSSSSASSPTASAARRSCSDAGCAAGRAHLRRRSTWGSTTSRTRRSPPGSCRCPRARSPASSRCCGSRWCTSRCPLWLYRGVHLVELFPKRRSATPRCRCPTTSARQRLVRRLPAPHRHDRS